MSKKTRKIIAITVAVTMVLAVVVSGVFLMCGENVNANPTAQEQAELDAIRNQITGAQGGLGGAQQMRTLNLPEMNRRNSAVTESDARLAIIQGRLDELRAELAVLEIELIEAQRQSDEYEEDFNERIRIMIESGPATYWQAFLNSDSFSDFIRRMNTIRTIAEYDEYVLGTLRALEQQIIDATVVIEEKEAEELELLAEEEAARVELVAAQTEFQEFMRELEADIAAYQRVYDEARRAEGALIREIQDRLTREGDDSTFIGGTFAWPVPGHRIGSGAGSRFGMRIHPITGRNTMHTGIDIPAPTGTNIVAANGGTVVFSGWNGGYGNCIIIDHGGGYSTLYGHNSVNLVSAGDVVVRGQVIGRVGSTGNSTGPHLHFEVRRNATPIDPMPFF